MARLEFDKYELRDDDGHRYVLPAELVESFVKLLDNIQRTDRFTDEWYDLNAELDNKFHSYMKG